MAERTLTISSAGKTFSVTGWKVGWVHGPGRARRGGARGQAVPHLRQRRAVPAGGRRRARLPDDVFYRALADDLQRKRDLLVHGPARRGLRRCSPPAGTYFVVADAAPLGFDDGAEFCWRLPERAGVAAVPVSVFHADPRAGTFSGAVRVLQARRGAHSTPSNDWRSCATASQLNRRHRRRKGPSNGSGYDCPCET